MRALHVHHDANSGSGLIGEALAARGIEQVVHQVGRTPGSPEGSPVFPVVEQLDPATDLIVLFGSRWSVYEDAAAHWVLPELDFLRSADAAGIAVLGICFGGQMLSAAHGGTVAPTDHPEIGWLTVSPHVPEIEPGPWLQWHFDAFTVPAAAEELAASPAGPQAFRLRRNLAVQFHPEADRAVLEGWYPHDLDQLEDARVDPGELLAAADRHLEAARMRADRLTAWFLGSFVPAR